MSSSSSELVLDDLRTYPPPLPLEPARPDSRRRTRHPKPVDRPDRRAPRRRVPANPPSFQFEPLARAADDDERARRGDGVHCADEGRLAVPHGTVRPEVVADESVRHGAEVVALEGGIDTVARDRQRADEVFARPLRPALRARLAIERDESGPRDEHLRAVDRRRVGEPVQVRVPARELRSGGGGGGYMAAARRVAYLR